MSPEAFVLRAACSLILIVLSSACSLQPGAAPTDPGSAATFLGESPAPQPTTVAPTDRQSIQPSAAPTVSPSETASVGLAACQDAMALALMEPDAHEVSRATMTRSITLGTAEALTDEADLIVIGTVGPMVREWTLPGSPDPSPAPGEEAPDTWVVMARDFQVDDVLKGDVPPGETISLTYLVEMPGDIPVVEYDARPLEGDGRYLLFLNDSAEGDIWFATGGPQGEFEVVEGLLEMMTTCYETGLDFHGRSPDEAEALIASFAEAP